MSFDQIYPTDRQCLVSDLVLGLRIFNLYQLDGFSVRLQFGEGESGFSTVTTGLKVNKSLFPSNCDGVLSGSKISPVVVQ